MNGSSRRGAGSGEPGPVVAEPSLVALSSPVVPYLHSVIGHCPIVVGPVQAHLSGQGRDAGRPLAWPGERAVHRLRRDGGFRRRRELPLTRRRERGVLSVLLAVMGPRSPPSGWSPRSGARRHRDRRSAPSRSRCPGCAPSSSPTGGAQGVTAGQHSGGVLAGGRRRRRRHVGLRVARPRSLAATTPGERLTLSDEACALWTARRTPTATRPWCWPRPVACGSCSSPCRSSGPGH